MSPFFILEREGAKATVRLNRPERHNALDLAELPGLTRAVAELGRDSALRVLVLTGAGDKSFCAGANLGDVGRGAWRGNPLAALSAALEALPVATICALNGSVYGGGSDLALACDFRIGVAGMKMRVPPAQLGVHYYVRGMERCVALLGLGLARRIYLTAESFEDRALHRIGFLDELVPRPAFAARVAEFAAHLAGLAPLAVAGMKRTLNEIAAGQVDRARADRAIIACYESEDFREGQAAFKEKRPPRFKGC